MSTADYVIDWRALSWVATDGTTENGGSAAPWRGLNQKPGITVSYRLGWGHTKRVPGVHTLTAAETTPVVVRGKTRQFPSTSGSFDVRGNARGELVLRIKAGPWGPNPATGRYASHRWNSRAYAVIKLKGDCGTSSPTDPPTPTPPPPAIPGASAASACVGTAAVIRVGLANTNVAGGNAFAFTVSAPAAGSKPSFSQSVTVAANGSSSLDVPVDENGSRTVTVAGNGFSQSFTRTGDCVDDPAPNAAAMQVCTDGLGAIRITLTNDNDAAGESVTFSVTSPATGSTAGVLDGHRPQRGRCPHRRRPGRRGHRADGHGQRAGHVDRIVHPDGRLRCAGAAERIGVRVLRRDGLHDRHDARTTRTLREAAPPPSRSM